jgi:glycosyltransferase involved in cell wall biosynthesis
VKIAILTYQLEMGGAEIVLLNIAKYLSSKGNKVVIYETLKEGNWKHYFVSNNINVVTLKINKFKSKSSHAQKVYENIKSFDVIFLNDAPYGQAVLSKLRPEVIAFPILHMSMNSMIYNATGNAGNWNKIIIVSNHLENEIIKIKKKILPEDIICIPNGIELPFSGNYVKRFDLAKGIRFVFLGRIEHQQKGVLLIPVIISKLAQKVKILEVNIYGIGPSLEDLMKLIQEHNLQDIIKCHGSLPHEKVFEILNQNDFLLMPSFFEGHPITLLEAMSAGVIPIVSRLEGRTDTVISNAVNGFLCRPGDPDSFADTIAQAIEKSKLEEVSINARNSVIKDYSYDSMGQSYHALIESEKNKNMRFQRSHKMAIELLGDLPYLPNILVRPVRKVLKICGLWSKS